MASTITIDILANTRGLVNGVNQTNQALGTLNNSASKIIAGFKGLGAALGLSLGINAIKGAVADLAAEEKIFAALEEKYGEDFEAIKEKIGNLASVFYVDKATIAQTVLNLRGALKAELDPLAPDLAEAAVVLAKTTNKPLEEIAGKLVTFLKDGKLTVKEIQSLGVDLTKEQQKQFDEAQKAGKGVEYILGLILSEENKKKAKDLTTSWEKLTFTLKEIRDKGIKPILDGFEKLFDFFTDEDKNGVPKINDNFKLLRDELLLVIGAFAVYKTALGIAKLIEALTKAQGLYNLALGITNTLWRANPIGLVITAITILIGIVILLVRKWDTVAEAFSKAGEWLGEVGKKIANFGKNVINGVIDLFGKVANSFKEWGKTWINVGKDIITGIWNGIKNMGSWIRTQIGNFFNDKVLGTIKKLFKIGSPSKVFAGYGKNLVEGLSIGISRNASLATGAMAGLSSSLRPSFAGARGSTNNYVTINAGVGTDPYELGRVVSAALDKYAGVNGR